MSQLIESIKVLENKLYRLEYHKRRMAKSHLAVYGSVFIHELTSVFDEISSIDIGLYKLRIIYDASNLSYEFIHYEQPLIQKIKIVESDSISYTYKFADRNELNKLFQLKQGSDDILIVKNNILTDTLYCNIALLKNALWYTPLTPLLHGTQRAALLDEKLIIPKSIRLSELHQYSEICLFNAMREFGEVILKVDDIIL